MPMRFATSCASSSSACGSDGDTAVTAIALSPNASCAALASSELSTPPENATITLSMPRSVSNSVSSFASMVVVVLIRPPCPTPAKGEAPFRAIPLFFVLLATNRWPLATD